MVIGGDGVARAFESPRFDQTFDKALGGARLILRLLRNENGSDRLICFAESGTGAKFGPKVITRLQAAEFVRQRFQRQTNPL